MTERLVRPVLLVVLLAGVWQPAGQARAGNPVHGRWVAQTPGGGTSYYQFHRATEQTQHFDKGRFVHVYRDAFGKEVTLGGTYTLRHHGQRGRLHLLFDNGLRLKDIEHAGKGWLQLRHAGSGLVLTYSRAP